MSAESNLRAKIKSGKRFVTMSDYANLSYEVLGMKRNTMYKKLRELKILNADNFPYSAYISLGYFKIERVGTLRNNVVRIKYSVKLTKKGQYWLIDTLKK